MNPSVESTWPLGACPWGPAARGGVSCAHENVREGVTVAPRPVPTVLLGALVGQPSPGSGPGSGLDTRPRSVRANAISFTMQRRATAEWRLTALPADTPPCVQVGPLPLKPNTGDDRPRGTPRRNASVRSPRTRRNSLGLLTTRVRLGGRTAPSHARRWLTAGQRPSAERRHAVHRQHKDSPNCPRGRQVSGAFVLGVDSGRKGAQGVTPMSLRDLGTGHVGI